MATIIPSASDGCCRILPTSGGRAGETTGISTASADALCPAAPAVLAAVAAGPPQVLAKVVPVEDHRVDPRRAEGLQPVFRGVEERRADALPAPGRADREPV